MKNPAWQSSADSERGPALGCASVASLPEVVYQELRNAILNGVFAPGQVLRQEDVAVRLGVSRSPLREALPRLEAEGIVVSNPRRGYAVAALEPTRIVEAFDLRMLLEAQLASHAVRKRTDADIALAYRTLGDMAALVDAEDLTDRTRWFDLNAEFHRVLMAPADLPLHMQALRTVSGIVEAYVRAEVRLTGDLTLAQAEHSQMCKTFALGDEQGFVSLIRDHANNTRSRLLAGLNQRDAAAVPGIPVLAAAVPGN